jgi:hypothetical protein
MSELRSVGHDGEAERFVTPRTARIVRDPEAAQKERPKFKESRCASRIQRRRKGLRLEVQGLIKAEIWCAVHDVEMQDLIDGLLRAFLAGQPSVTTQLRRAKRSPFSTIDAS